MKNRWPIRSVAGLLFSCFIGACSDAPATRALPLVGPFASNASAPIGVDVATLLAERPLAKRAPLGGVREVAGDWILHYDVPAPTSEELFPTMRVTEVTALRALPDSFSAAQLRDSLIAEIGTPTAPRCVTVRRGRVRAPVTVIRGGDREYALGFWWRDAPGSDSTASAAGVRDSVSTGHSTGSAASIPLPVAFAITYRQAVDTRPGEEVASCSPEIPAVVK